MARSGVRLLGLPQLKKKYQKMQGLLLDKTSSAAIFKRIIVTMQSSIAKNFRAEGRPTAWKKLKKDTTRGRKGRKTFKERANLAKKIRAKRAKGDAPLQLLSLTLLSNMEEATMKANAMLDNGTGVCLPFKKPEEYVEWKASRSFEAGADGFIASGRFVKFVRGLFEDGHPLIVTPGVRPAGTSHAEHKNVLTPREAIRSGSDYLVVGRPIRDAESPRAATLAVVQEITEALESLEAS